MQIVIINSRFQRVFWLQMTQTGHKHYFWTSKKKIIMTKTKQDSMLALYANNR